MREEFRMVGCSGNVHRTFMPSYTSRKRTVKHDLGITLHLKIVLRVKPRFPDVHLGYLKRGSRNLAMRRDVFPSRMSKQC